MSQYGFVDVIDRQRWLGQTADQLAPAVRSLLEGLGPNVKNTLHGTWLGHPLHPAITDVPVGAWTAAAVFDGLAVFDNRPEWDQAARAAIGLGLAGAAGAAVTGLADWSETDGRARRLGLTHGLMNVAAVLCYVTSLASRNRASGRARAWALGGYGLALASSYLGGHLVFNEKIGVSHAGDPTDVPEAFTPVMRADSLGEGQMKKATLDGVPILLVRQQGVVHAMHETCSHLGGPLSEGKLDAEGVTCPWHGSRFALEDGRVLNGPSAHKQPVFEARIGATGDIEVRRAEITARAASAPRAQSRVWKLLHGGRARA